MKFTGMNTIIDCRKGIKRSGMVLFLTLVLSSFCLLSKANAETKPGARIEFPAHRTIDLGLISADTISSGEITFRNTGTQPLVITQVFADCNCTIPSYPHEPVEPGDSATITVKYDSRGLRHGPFLKIIKVRSDSDHPLGNIFVKGTIRRPRR